MVAKKTANKKPVVTKSVMDLALTHINAHQVYTEFKSRGIPSYYDKIVKDLDAMNISSIQMPWGSKTTKLYEYGPVREYMARIIAKHETKQVFTKVGGHVVSSSDDGHTAAEIRGVKEMVASLAGAMVRLNQKIDSLTEVCTQFGKAGEQLTLELERRFDELGHDIDTSFSLLLDALVPPLPRPADGTEIDEAAGMPQAVAKKGDDDLDAALSSTDD